jgi:hypothetical protein
MEITQQCVHIDEVIVILFGEPVDVISLACFVIEAKDAYAIRNKREPVFVTMGASGKRPRYTPDDQFGEQHIRHGYPAL